MRLGERFGSVDIGSSWDERIGGEDGRRQLIRLLPLSLIWLFVLIAQRRIVIGVFMEVMHRLWSSVEALQASSISD